MGKRAIKAKPGAGPDTSHIAEALRSLAVPVSDLVPDPANARLHNPSNIAAIRGSLRVHGQVKPVVVRKKTMVVVCGNGTLAAAVELGWTHIAANVLDIDAATAASLAIADNRTAELASWDNDNLDALLKSIQTDDADLAAMLAGLAKQDAPIPEEQAAGMQSIPEKFQVLVECGSENQQAELLERLTAEGITCRSLIC